MTDVLRAAVDNLVEETLNSNYEFMMKSIMQNASSSDSSDVLNAKMLTNAIHYSTHASVQIMVELLLQTGILVAADESDLRKHLLNLVKK